MVFARRSLAAPQQVVLEISVILIRSFHSGAFVEKLKRVKVLLIDKKITTDQNSVTEEGRVVESLLYLMSGSLCSGRE